MTADPDGAAGGLRHMALLYGGADYLDAARGLVQEAQARNEPVLIAVPRTQATALRLGLAGQLRGVEFTNMAGLGRNPARITSALLTFAAAHGGRRVFCLTERVWPGRSAAEIREVNRNEALTNLALVGTQATVVCPYSTAELRPPVLAEACRTHPILTSGTAEQHAAAYRGSGYIPAASARPLGQPPSRRDILTYGADLKVVRDFVAQQARRGGLDAGRVGDLILAVSEIAANTLRHTRPPGTLRTWRTRDEFLCQVDDAGQIADPLVGLYPPSLDKLGGQGLWVVNDLCDLVERRSGKQGTTIRLHMLLRSPAEPIA